MLNIIRMNWYRLWNTPSMIILLFLTAGMAFFSGTMEVEDVKLMQENQEKKRGYHCFTERRYKYRKYNVRNG